MSQPPQTTPPTESPAQARQGDTPPLDTDAQRRAAVSLAVDYRGDITVRTVDAEFTGYAFDADLTIADPYLRLIPADGAERRKIRVADITQIAFSGKDTAFGKSWEAWVRKHEEMKKQGLEAEINPESLDEV